MTNHVLHRKRAVLVVCLLSGLAAIAALVVTLPGAASGTVSGATGRSVGVGLAAHFRVIARSANRENGSASGAGTGAAAAGGQLTPLPQAVAVRYGSRVGRAASLGIDPAAATYVAIDSSAGAWVVPGASGVCLVAAPQGPGNPTFGGCALTTQAEQGALLLETAANDGSNEVVYGLAPNTVAPVTALHGDGSTTAVTVVDGVYRLAVTQPTILRFPVAGGVTDTQSVPILGPAPAG